MKATMSLSTNHPWRDIPTASRDAELVAKRVDVELKYDFFWARDVDGNPLLIMELPHAFSIGALPRLNGLEVKHVPGHGGTPSILAWTLRQWEHEELFHYLCMDVVHAAEGTATIDAAAPVALNRTWRWHHLLRGGGPGRLAPHEQLGLMAELSAIEAVLLPQLSPMSAMDAWKGPLGAAQDFSHRGTAIEVKGLIQGGPRRVNISSEFQLDSTHHAALWLAVFTFRREEAANGRLGATLEAMVDRIGASLATDPGASSAYQRLLAAVGYDANHKYDDIEWALEGHHYFRVDASFPVITPGMLPNGISSVSYSLALNVCAPSQQEHIILNPQP